MADSLPCFSRGQSALDLLLGLLVLLMVLSAFSPVMDRFESSLKEISLHRQLENNISLASFFVTGASWYAHHSTGPNDPARITNSFTHISGTVPIPPVRATGLYQGVSCSIDATVPAPSFLSFSIDGEQVGLPSNVLVEQSLSLVTEYTIPPGTSWGGCVTSLAIPSGGNS